MNDRIEKIKEIFANEELAKEVLSIEQPEDAQKWFSDHGVEFTLDEIKELGEMLQKVAKGEITKEDLDKQAELSEDDLEDVAGGSVVLTITGLALTAAAAAIASLFRNRW